MHIFNAKISCRVERFKRNKESLEKVTAANTTRGSTKLRGHNCDKCYTYPLGMARVKINLFYCNTFDISISSCYLGCILLSLIWLITWVSPIIETRRAEEIIIEIEFSKGTFHPNENNPEGVRVVHSLFYPLEFFISFWYVGIQNNGDWLIAHCYFEL